MRQVIAAVRHSVTPFGLGLLCALAALFVGCGDQTGMIDPTSGAVGTGNAGRVKGSIVASAAARTAIQVRLLAADSLSSAVDSLWTDSSGAFEFPSHSPGAYRVELWKNGILRGESGTFKVNGDVSGLLVVLVQGVFQQTLDLSSLGTVDSVFVDYRGNPGVKIGALWRVQTLRDSAFVLHVHIGTNPGRWEEWVLVRRDGQNLFVNLADSRAMDFQRIVDTTSFLLTPRTVALWTFDSVVAGSAIRDLSPNGNDLTISGAARFVASPHGNAFEQSTGKPLVVGTSLPSSLRWSRTGSMTYEMRLRLDSLPLTGMVLMGSYGGPRIWVTAFGQVVVENLMSHEAGQSVLSVVTEVGKIPVGKWIDLAVSVDGRSSQVYVWVDEQAQSLFMREEWPTGAALALDPSGPLCVGGASWDERPSHFQIDEVRISDTLVFGKGPELQSSFEVTVEGTSIGEGLALSTNSLTFSVCPGCAQVRIGLDSAGTGEGYYAWNVQVPKAVAGKRIVSAILCAWSSGGWVPATKRYSAHSILEPWISGSSASGWFDPSGRILTSRVDPAAFSVAPLNAGSSGGLIFDISGMMQVWAKRVHR